MWHMVNMNCCSKHPHRFAQNALALALHHLMVRTWEQCFPQEWMNPRKIVSDHSIVVKYTELSVIEWSDN
ncbi:hypothetical protein KC19_11G172000 [Ceratodon purpureus]|uniref:Uncharacterized protein n=1 Tax=Ceratodon purpureus TaxID=3225 RepID=A0A8T0GIA2_CERPU|nr:hypothetical protein KC19_N007900 [Ceratodon purpureus]KAG0558004.1 hypothetical protein KC19_11G172000 [Ceratodon purpureus]